ncbi:M16 family metallopeptidase [Nitratifractor sp.]
MAATLLHVDVKGVKIPVVFEAEKRLPLASMELVFQNSGSLADTKAGIASLCARLLGEGTKKEGATAFATALENRAVHLSAETGRETFVLSLEALKSEFDFAVGKMNDLLNDPNTTPEAFKKVQTQTLGILKQKESDFDYVAATRLRTILFEGTPLAHPSLGTPESVSAMKLEELKKYLSDHLRLDNLIVVIGGKFTPEEVKSAVEKAVKGLKEGRVKPIPHFGANGKRRETVTYEETDQAYIYFGAPYTMAADDPRRVLGKVAAFILGSGGFGSRLMEEIRVKRGLAYSAYGRFVVNRTHSYFSGYLQTKLKSGEEAKKVVQEVLDDFLKKGVTAEELEGAKKFFLGSEPLRTETLSQRMNRAFHEYYDGLGLDWSEKELNLIREMKLEDLNTFIRNHPEIGELSWSIVTKKSAK